jgi:hypothetical protein
LQLLCCLRISLLDLRQNSGNVGDAHKDSDLAMELPKNACD